MRESNASVSDRPTLRFALRKAFCVFAAVAFLLLASQEVSAQRSYNPEFYIGARGGATLSQTSFTPSVRQGWLPGMTFGVSARYTEEKYFGLIAEVNVTQRGWKEDYDGLDFNYERTLTYVQVPVMTHIYFGRRFKGFVNLGPYVSYLISSSINSNFDWRNPAAVEGFPMRNRPTEQLSMEIENKMDYGIVGGLGMELTVARRHSLILEGRYYFGIGNIFHAAKKDVFSASRGSSIEVAVSYMFRMK